MSPEQVAGVEALAAAIPVVLARRDEDWPEFAGRTARAISERLSEAGWQLTRAGDEERLRAELDRDDWRSIHLALQGFPTWFDETAAKVQAIEDVIDAKTRAPEPPSPASQGEKG